jgi:hypothetical protein
MCLEAELAVPGFGAGITHFEQPTAGSLFFHYEIRARDLEALVPEAELDVREMAFEVVAVVKTGLTVVVVEVDEPPIRKAYRMGPYAAHFADEMLGSDRTEGAVDGSEHIHLAPRQHIGCRMGIVAVEGDASEA